MTCSPPNAELGPQREQLGQIRSHIGCPVEMLAGEDELTADRGMLVGIRAGDHWTEQTALVEFESNGRWAIPVGLLFIPDIDQVCTETSAFILCGPLPRERRLMSIAVRLQTQKASSQKERTPDCSSP